MSVPRNNLYDLGQFDPARKMLLRFQQWHREAERAAAQASKSADEQAYAKAFAQRREFISPVSSQSPALSAPSVPASVADQQPTTPAA